MVKTLEVYLDGLRCGTLSQASTGNLAFDYDEGYRTMPQATPLSLSLPLSAVSHRKRTVLPFFQGLLPDNPFALEATARRYGVSPRNPFALLEHLGADVAGALQVLAPGTPPTDGQESQERERVVEEKEIAELLRAVVEEYQTGATADGGIGRFSLAGAQPKIALRRLHGRWSVPWGGAATTHILKPVIEALPAIDVIEHMTMRAASLLGLTVAHSELASFAGTRVFVTQRYDRVIDDNRVLRIHQEDLCQALSVSPDRKYQHRDGGPGVGAIRGLFRSLPRPADQEAVSRDFFTALAFNTLAGCTDAHAKNYSLLLDGASVRLAPLYDLASIAAQWDGLARAYVAMSIGGEYALNKIRRDDLVHEGLQLGVEDAEEIVAAIRGSLVDSFATAKKEVVDDNPDATNVASRLLDGVAKMPLLATTS